MKKNNALILDDDVLTGLNLKSALTKLGFHKVVFVQSCKEVLSHLKTTSFSIAFINIDLEDNQGLQWAKCMQSDYFIPCVYLTAYLEEDHVQETLEAEPFGVLIKPFTQRELEITTRVITYRAQKEKELLLKEKWIDAIISNVFDAIIVVDNTFKITFMNSKAETMLGETATSLQGRKLERYLSFFDENDYRFLLPPFKRAIRRKLSVVDRRVKLLNSQGVSCMVDCSTSPIIEHDICKGAVIGFHLI